MREIIKCFALSRRTLTAAVSYVILLAAMIMAISLKTNYHVDEVFSYGLANNAGNDIAIQIQNGVKYEPAEQVYDEYIRLAPENRFHYRIPYVNQENDNHPPLYYFLLHTICSFFPGKFSNWYAGAINIVFALACLFVFRKLAACLLQERTLIELLSVGFALSAGILQNAAYFRMYVMAMFWITGLCWVYISYVGKDLDRRFCVRTFLIVLLGALTHYYCIFFAVILSVAFGVYLLTTKKPGNVIRFCASTIY